MKCKPSMTIAKVGLCEDRCVAIQTQAEDIAQALQDYTDGVYYEQNTPREQRRLLVYVWRESEKIIKLAREINDRCAAALAK